MTPIDDEIPIKPVYQAKEEPIEGIVTLEDVKQPIKYEDYTFTYALKDAETCVTKKNSDDPTMIESCTVAVWDIQNESMTSGDETLGDDAASAIRIAEIEEFNLCEPWTRDKAEDEVATWRKKVWRGMYIFTEISGTCVYESCTNLNAITLDATAVVSDQ